MEIDLVATAEHEKWQELVFRSGIRVAAPMSDEPEASQNIAGVLVALPGDLGPGSRFLEGEFHLDGRVAHWAFRLMVVRDPNPSAVMVELSRLVGGYPGVLGRLAGGWPGDRTVELAYRATFLVEQSAWLSTLVPRKRPSPGTRLMGKGPESAVLDRVSYTWKIDPPGPVAELTDTGPVGMGWVGVTARGKIKAELGPQMFERVEAESWGILSDFLRPVRRPKRGRN